MNFLGFVLFLLGSVAIAVPISLVMAWDGSERSWFALVAGGFVVGGALIALGAVCVAS